MQQFGSPSPGLMAKPNEKADNQQIRVSGGEFVVPAEVVRFLGVEKLNKMVDQTMQKIGEMQQQGFAQEPAPAQPGSSPDPRGAQPVEDKMKAAEGKSEIPGFATGGFVTPVPNYVQQQDQVLGNAMRQYEELQRQSAGFAVTRPTTNNVGSLAYNYVDENGNAIPTMVPRYEDLYTPEKFGINRGETAPTPGADPTPTDENNNPTEEGTRPLITIPQDTSQEQAVEREQGNRPGTQGLHISDDERGYANTYAGMSYGEMDDAQFVDALINTAGDPIVGAGSKMGLTSFALGRLDRWNARTNYNSRFGTEFESYEDVIADAYNRQTGPFRRNPDGSVALNNPEGFINPNTGLPWGSSPGTNPAGSPAGGGFGGIISGFMNWVRGGPNEDTTTPGQPRQIIPDEVMGQPSPPSQPSTPNNPPPESQVAGAGGAGSPWPSLVSDPYSPSQQERDDAQERAQDRGYSDSYGRTDDPSQPGALY